MASRCIGKVTYPYISIYVPLRRSLQVFVEDSTRMDNKPWQHLQRHDNPAAGAPFTSISTGDVILACLIRLVFFPQFAIVCTCFQTSGLNRNLIDVSIHLSLSICSNNDTNTERHSVSTDEYNKMLTCTV